MKTFKYILLITVCLVVTAVYAQPSEADFIKISKEYTLHADGSSDMHYQKQVKLNTHISFNSLYGETFIVYNPQHQKVVINHCYTIQQDGKRIEAPGNAFNEVLPSFAANAPAYNHLRELVVTHTGLEIGATVYLDYTIHTSAGYCDGVTANEIMQENSPVKEYIISAEAPAGTEIFYNQYNCPEPTKQGNKLTWTMKNVPAAPREAWQAADGRQAPRVTFTTVPNDRMLAQLAAQITAPGTSIKKKTAELAAGEKDAQKKAANIISFVQNGISTVNIPLEYNGYKFRPVDEVYRTAYGTPVEKAALLAAMLSEAGIDAKCAIAVPAFLQKDNMHAALWMCAANEFPVSMEINNMPSYASPVREGTYGWNDMDKLCYALEKGTILPLPQVMQSVAVQYNYTISEVKNDKKELTLDAEKSGYYGVTVTGGRLDTLRNESGKTSLSLIKNDNYYTAALPSSNAGVDSWGIRSLSGEPRKTMLEILAPVNERYVYTFTIPAGFQCSQKDIDIKKEKKIGNIQISYKTDAAANTLTVTRSIQLNQRILSPADYKDFKELMDAWNTPAYRMVLVK